MTLLQIKNSRVVTMTLWSHLLLALTLLGLICSEGLAILGRLATVDIVIALLIFMIGGVAMDLLYRAQR